MAETFGTPCDTITVSLGNLHFLQSSQGDHFYSNFTAILRCEIFLLTHYCLCACAFVYAFKPGTLTKEELESPHWFLCTKPMRTSPSKQWENNERSSIEGVWVRALVRHRLWGTCNNRTMWKFNGTMVPHKRNSRFGRVWSQKRRQCPTSAICQVWTRTP